jgi:hypothetical protein
MSVTNLNALSPSSLTSLLTNSTPVIATGTTATAAPSATTTYTPTPVSPNYTYAMPGVSAAQTNAPSSTAGLIWQNNSSDAISQQMGSNLSSPSLAGYYGNLGADLLSRYASTTTDYSQSVAIPPPPGQLSGKPNEMLAGDVTLNITTASGNTVALEIKSGDDGSLAVSAHSSCNLTPAEQTAVANLAKGFQSAIDGLTGATTGSATVNVSSLLQVDPTVLSSVNLNIDLYTENAARTTLNFQEGGGYRSLNLSLPQGKVSMNTDLTNLATVGSKAQQSAALKSYLQQFSQEETRDPNNTDPTLMQAFSASFSQLNSNYPSGIVPKFSGAPTVQTDQDHAMLTGLADFQASVTQTPTSPNQLHPGETNQFNYEMSQQTMVSGTDYADRTITQKQSSSLVASYHIWYPRPATAPPTTKLRASQNYYYEQINDSASAATDIGYQKGQLTQASITKSASQSRHETKYSDANLVEDATFGVADSQSVDLMALLAPLQKDDPQDANQRAKTLAAINANIDLENDPAQLPFSEDLLDALSATTTSTQAASAKSAVGASAS